MAVPPVRQLALTGSDQPRAKQFALIDDHGRDQTRPLPGARRQPNAVPAVQDPGTVSQGGQAQPACDAAQADEVERLSNREETILELLMQGVSNKHIARELNIAEATVKVHVKSLFRKIRVSNRTQAAMWGRDRVRPNGQPKQLPASSPPGGDSDMTSGTIPNADKADSQSGLHTAAALGQVHTEIDFKGGFAVH